MTATTIGTEPARIDLEVRAGEPVDFTVPVYDGDGDAQNLAGWTLLAQARVSRSAVLATLTTAAVAPSGTPGTVGYDPGGVRITAADDVTATWADWPVSVARWALWLTPPAGEATPFATGWVRVHSS